MKRSLLFLVCILIVGVVSATAQTYPITDFDGYASGTAVLFNAPGFSGSTSSNVKTGTDHAWTTGADSNSTTESLEVAWDWADGVSSPTAWVRLTTYNAANVPNPVIEYDKALTFWIKIVEGDVSIELLSRDNGAAGAIGTDGGGSGAIERITPPGGAIYLDSAVNSNWQQVVIDIPLCSISAFTGNGALDNASGTIEALRINKGDSSAVSFFIDDVQMEPSSIAGVKDWKLF
jgi:hypothetical protein